MPFFATTYTYVADTTEARDATRPAHREYLDELSERGGVLLSGPHIGGEPAALLVFDAPSEAEARELIGNDPFVIGGLVAEITVREWLPVSGRLATQV